MLATKRPIVVGIDGSDGAVAAARWAAALAARFDAPLHLVHAVPDAGHLLTEAAATLRAATMTYHHEYAAQFLQQAADAVRDEVPGLSFTTAAVEWSAVDALIDASRGAQMVVLGSDAVTPAVALLLGSTTVAVATHARCPVILAHNAGTAPTGAPVVVGVDYTDTGTAALEAAFEVAERRQLGVEAVHAWSRLLPAGEVTIPFLIDWEALETAEMVRLTDVVDKVASRHPDVKVECFIEPQRPARGLLRHSVGAGLVVVGTRGRGSLTGMALGSTSLNMMQHCRVPLMICRGGDRKP